MSLAMCGAFCIYTHGDCRYVGLTARQRNGASGVNDLSVKVFDAVASRLNAYCIASVPAFREIGGFPTLVWLLS